MGGCGLRKGRVWSKKWSVELDGRGTSNFSIYSFFLMTSVSMVIATAHPISTWSSLIQDYYREGGRREGDLSQKSLPSRIHLTKADVKDSVGVSSDYHHHVGLANRIGLLNTNLN